MITEREQKEVAKGQRSIVRLHSKFGAGEIHVIGRGRYAYVWIGDQNGRHLTTIRGTAALRQRRDVLSRALGEGPAP